MTSVYLKLKKYEDVAATVKKNDNNYIVTSISGVIYYEELDDCLKIKTSIIILSIIFSFYLIEGFLIISGLGVKNNEEVFMPKPSLKINDGDRIVLFSLSKMIKKVENLLSVRFRFY